jgi:pimeloyl-ACP methyl ester carboxylesterase
MERLSRFRSEHPCKSIDVAGVAWEYIACGHGAEVLLLLTGGLRVAEASFVHIQMFEGSYHVIAPTYPPVKTMDALLTGITAILDAEGVSEAYALGQSYGGLVAQVLIQRYPSQVTKVVLSGTAPLIVVRWKTLLTHLFLPLVALFPERVVMGIFKRILRPMVTVQASERAFWDTYLEELLGRRLSRADLLSHLQTTRDAYLNYALHRGEKSPWPGDVQVIWGEHDHLNTERAQRGMLEIYRQAQIHVIEGAGHTVAMAKPEEYAAAVKGFLGE